MTRLRTFAAVMLMLVAVSAVACNQAPESGDKTVQVTELARDKPAPTPASAPRVPAVGKPMPQFEFTALDGETDSFSNYRGEPLLVNIWGTWCRPCVSEIPHFVDFYRAHEDDNVGIISLAVNDTVQAVKKYLETQEMPWVLGMDTEGVAKRWVIRGVPTTYFVNSQGMVVQIHLGSMTREMMESLAAPLFE